MEQILVQTTAAFAALDFAAENDRIAECQAEITRCEKAIQAADKRCTEIARIKNDYRGPSGQAVANALLGDTDVSEAALAGSSLEKMEEERLSLRAGIGELRRRIDDNTSEISAIQLEASGKAARAAKPMVEALLDRAREAGGTLLAAWASIRAIQAATRGHNQSEGLLYSIATEVTGSSALLPDYSGEVDVPEEVRATLEGLMGKGAALRSGVLRKAVLRHPPIR